MDCFLKDKPIKSKESQAIVLSTIANIGLLVVYYYIGPLPGVMTKLTVTLIGVSKRK